MNVNFYEKLWMWFAAAIIVVFITFVGITTFAYGVRPPSHIETVDPTQVMSDPRFAQQGVTANADGSVTATLVAGTSFLPFPCRTRMSMRWESISPSCRDTTSETRRPAP